MNKKNNIEPSTNQIDALLIIGIVIIASTGYDGWGWLVAILICRHL
jgi:hypothetical protein